MAFRLKHWIAVLVLACSGVTIAYLPDANGIPGSQMTRRSQTRYVDGWWVTSDGPLQLWEAAETYRELDRSVGLARIYERYLELADSLLTAVPSDVSDSSRVVFSTDGQVPAAARIAWEAALNQLSGGLSPRGLPIAFALTVDLPGEVGAVAWRTRQLFFVPRKPGDPCVSAVTLSHRVVEHTNAPRLVPSGLLDGNPSQLLGPCAYYATFGLPGVSIRAWLDNWEHATALLPNWVAIPPYEDPWRIALRNVREEPLGVEQRTWNVRFYSSLVQCASGDLASCRASLLGIAREQGPADELRPEGLVEEWSRHRWLVRRTLGGGTASFLSDLLLDRGRDQFAEFWASNQPLDSAFAGAFGLPLEEWMRAWSQAQVGFYHPGPVPRRGAASMALILAAGFVVSGVAIGWRRSVA